MARGVRRDGSVCVYVWGRADMGATASAASTSGSSDDGSIQPPRDILPRELPRLPCGGDIAEVWCGSEYTIVSSELGYLWSCGWNEHGNLGIGEIVDSLSEWKPVVFSTGTVSPPGGETVEGVLSACVEVSRLLSVWDGSLCCGGGHCVALLKRPSC